MSTRVSVDGMVSAIAKQMNEYRDLSAESVKKAVKKAGKTVCQEIESTAPNLTGKYAASWVSKTTAESSTGIEVTVSSPSRYMLSHLLEYGHAKRGGGGRVRAYPHIEPAQAVGEDKLVRDIKRALG